MRLTSSIVMSTYNGSPYIKQQLESLQNQNMEPDEVLIFDDCSQDNTFSIISQFIRQHKLSNWKLTQNQNNKGWERNFMDGLKLATGDLVFFCDQDDLWHPDKIKTMVNIMSENSQIQLLVSNYKKIFPNSPAEIGPNVNNSRLEPYPLVSNYTYVPYPGCVYCVRNSLAEISYKYWFPKCPHDALLWRLAMFSKSLYVLNEDLIDWRQHKDSAFQKQSSNKTINYQINWMKYAERVNQTMEQFIEDEHLGDDCRQLLVKNNQYLKLRQKFYMTGNPIYVFRLLFYLHCFPRKRSILRDLYTVYIKRDN